MGSAPHTYDVNSKIYEDRGRPTRRTRKYRSKIRRVVGDDVIEICAKARYGTLVSLDSKRAAHEPVTPYEWGETLARGVTAHEVGAICPDDGALLIAIGPGLLAFADAVIGWQGELAFVPDFLMDEPDRVKPATVAALERLLDRAHL